MKPIIFSTSMVRAIQEGRKTMTRRVVPLRIVNAPMKCYPIGTSEADFYLHFSRWHKGDILWVRETWATSCFDFKPDGSGGKNPLPTEPIRQSSFIYKANGTFNPVWKPSIFMPREAARLFLRVTDVRIERLQGTTEEDAKAEGCEQVLRKTNGTVLIFARNAYRVLWDSLNAKRGYSWDSNPLVYVISFKRINKEEAEKWA